MAAVAKAETKSSGAFSFLACIADEVTRETVSRAVSHLGWPHAKVRPGGIDAAMDAVDVGTPPRLLLVDTTGTAEPAAAIAELAKFCGPATRLVAIGAVNDVGLYRQLMALGVAEYLVKPVSSEVLYSALAAALQTDVGPVRANAPRSMRLFVFLGARGGVGATTLTIAAAWLLAHEWKQRTALLDLDLHFGNLALSLDIEPGRGLREALEHPERTDGLLLASAMVSADDKLPVLAGEEPLDEALRFDEAATAPLLEALAEGYDCLVVDLPRSLDSMGRQLLAAADAVVVVTDLSLSALRDTQRLVDLTKGLGCRAKPLLVANQVGAAHRGEIGRTEFERGLGAGLDYLIPFDAKAAAATARGGKALPAAAGSSKAVIELRRLAQRLSGREEKPRSGFKRWFG